MLFHELTVGGTLARQWRNQRNTMVLPPVFLENLRFSIQFGRGFPRKITGKAWKTMLFHELIVGGTLARQ